MPGVNYIRVDSKDQLQEKMTGLANRLGAFWDFSQHALIVTYEAYADPRTRSQNNLYWYWLNEMGDFYSTPSQAYNKDDMHDLMRHKFLGYEDRTIGNTVLKGQLRSTTGMKKQEMSEYMEKIEAWCADNGLNLMIPHANEYFKYKEASQ